MIGLCSKTYVEVKKKTKFTSNTILAAARLLRRSKKLKPKRMHPKCTTFYEKNFSCKGISKKTLLAPLSVFRDVLKTQRTGTGSNKGFRARHNTVYTYQQQRSVFSYFYCKRRVLDDGRTTVPLDLELCPQSKEPMEEEEVDESMDWDPQDVENVHILASLIED